MDGTSLAINGSKRYFNNRLDEKIISLGVDEVELLTRHCAKSLTPFHPIRIFLIDHLEKEKKMKVVRVLTPLDVLFRDSGHIKLPGDAYELLMKPVELTIMDLFKFDNFDTEHLFLSYKKVHTSYQVHSIFKYIRDILLIPGHASPDLLIEKFKFIHKNEKLQMRIYDHLLNAKLDYHIIYDNLIEFCNNYLQRSNIPSLDQIIDITLKEYEEARNRLIELKRSKDEMMAFEAYFNASVKYRNTLLHASLTILLRSEIPNCEDNEKGKKFNSSAEILYHIQGMFSKGHAYAWRFNKFPCHLVAMRNLMIIIIPLMKMSSMISSQTVS